MNWKWPLLEFRWAIILLLGYVIVQSLWLALDNPLHIILIVITIIPAIIYIAFVRRSDVGQKEPRGAVAFGMLMGIISIYPTIFLEEEGLQLLNRLDLTSTNAIDISVLLYNFLFAFLVIALTEEGMKFVFFLLTHLITKENDQPTDSIVYCVAVSGGFALFENYRYVIAASTYSFEHGFVVALLRTLTAIPVHLGLGLLMGYYLSQYYYPEKLGLMRSRRKSYLVLGIFVPILVHGIYDFFIFTLYRLANYLDVVFAIIFAVFLSIFAWRRTITIREIQNTRSGSDN